nr:immunoglobulin heavy chain junction region [Macaca mulatta]MOV50773.1 immunoglobulin heavy chain junction region [Macaca mulatta]MOV50778.1 immunoglobulin heavy chain junction region [Macaca mulatta]MOV50896.1 immunoglobulin heavy chain junction region [Macaca mulatta]
CARGSDPSYYSANYYYGEAAYW